MFVKNKKKKEMFEEKVKALNTFEEMFKINGVHFHLKKLEKEEQIKLKSSLRKEIIKNKA